MVKRPRDSGPQVFLAASSSGVFGKKVWSLAPQLQSYDDFPRMPCDVSLQPNQDPSSLSAAHTSRVVTSQSALSHAEYIREIFRFRGVFWVMAGRDVLVRYRYAIFGVAWAVLRPLCVLITFSAIFKGLVAREGPPGAYTSLVLCAAPLWIFFSATVQDSIGFVLRDAGLMNRAYFPRILLIFSGVSVGVVDFIISLGLVVLALYVSGVLYTPHVALLPLAVVWSVLLVGGCALWVSTLNTRYRDVSNVVPFGMHLLLVMSPVGYATSNLPAEYLRFLALNPLVGLLELFRYCLLGSPISGGASTVVIGVLITGVLVLTGYVLFRRMESWINDYA